MSRIQCLTSFIKKQIADTPCRAIEIKQTTVFRLRLVLVFTHFAPFCIQSLFSQIVLTFTTFLYLPLCKWIALLLLEVQQNVGQAQEVT